MSSTRHSLVPKVDTIQVISHDLFVQDKNLKRWTCRADALRGCEGCEWRVVLDYAKIPYSTRLYVATNMTEVGHIHLQDAPEKKVIHSFNPAAQKYFTTSGWFSLTDEALPVWYVEVLRKNGEVAPFTNYTFALTIECRQAK